MIKATCDDNGRKWRVEGPDWTMQPVGMLSATQAEAVCKTTAHALALDERPPAIETQATPDDGWRWFAGDNEEMYYVGPHDSRESALDEATKRWPAMAIHLVEARQDPIDLARWIDVDGMVERLHESLGDDLGGEDGESPAENAWTDAQHADLEKAIEAAVSAWQSRHRIVVTPRTFTASRNAEIVVPAEIVATNVVVPADTPIAPEVLAALVDDSTAVTCFGCGQAMKDGDPYYEDVNEGPMHAACCGPEPESFVDAEGEPLKAGDPIPAPGTYRAHMPAAE